MNWKILRHVLYSLNYLPIYASTTCVSGGYDEIAECESECLNNVFLLSSEFCHFSKDISLVGCVCVCIYVAWNIENMLKSSIFIVGSIKTIQD